MARKTIEDIKVEYPVGTTINDKTITEHVMKDRTYLVLHCNVCGVDKEISYGNLNKYRDTITRHSSNCNRRTKEDLMKQYFIGRVINDKTIVEHTVNSRNELMLKLRCNVCGIEKSNSVTNLESGFDTITRHGKSCKMHCTLSSEVIHRPEFGNCADKIYSLFCRMHRFCESPDCPDYKHYGARGISVSPLFSFNDEGYTNFSNYVFPSLIETAKYYVSTGHYANMDEALFSTRALSLDRIDVNGNYEPGNIRWATRQTQNINRRNNIGKEFFAFSPDGKIYYTNSVSAFCTNHGLDSKHTYDCLNKGFSPAYTRSSVHGWTFRYNTYRQVFPYDVTNQAFMNNVIVEMY